jgi:hypothetical protein
LGAPDGRGTVGNPGAVGWCPSSPAPIADAPPAGPPTPDVRRARLAADGPHLEASLCLADDRGRPVPPSSQSECARSSPRRARDLAAERVTMDRHDQREWVERFVLDASLLALPTTDPGIDLNRSRPPRPPSVAPDSAVRSLPGTLTSRYGSSMPTRVNASQEIHTPGPRQFSSRGHIRLVTESDATPPASAQAFRRSAHDRGVARPLSMSRHRESDTTLSPTSAVTRSGATFSRVSAPVTRSGAILSRVLAPVTRSGATLDRTRAGRRSGYGRP